MASFFYLLATLKKYNFNSSSSSVWDLACMSILVSFTALQAFKNSFSPSDNAVLLLLPKGALLFGGAAVVSICSDGGGGGDGEFAISWRFISSNSGVFLLEFISSSSSLPAAAITRDVSSKLSSIPMFEEVFRHLMNGFIQLIPSNIGFVLCRPEPEGCFLIWRKNIVLILLYFFSASSADIPNFPPLIEKHLPFYVYFWNPLRIGPKSLEMNVFLPWNWHRLQPFCSIFLLAGLFTKEHSQHRVLTCCELSQCIAEVVNSREQS